MSDRLIGLIAADLPDHRRGHRSDGRVVFTPVGGGPILELQVRVEKRFLGRTEIARFRSVAPAPAWKIGKLRVHHTGRLRRQGVGVEIEAGAEMIASLAATLNSDPGFVEPVSALDFTRFDIDLDGETCSATVELMGASLVSIAFPPIRSYVRLHDDQREALLAGLTSLFRLTAG